ncbi:MAG: DUF333 domain-containing protein, partial [Ilumatobacteraceae bacterium]
MRRSKIAWALAMVLFVSACGDDNDGVPSETSSPQSALDDEIDTAESEIGNPASQFCEQQGGTVEIVDEQGGQVGYCNLPDGSRGDEWDLYQSQGNPTETAFIRALEPDFDGQVGWFPSLSIGPDGAVVIAHHDRGNGSL